MTSKIWAQTVEKLAAAYLNRQAAYGDPYWMTAKYPGKTKDGTPVKRGDKVLYWPRTKTLMVGPEAEQAWRDFKAEVADEDFYNHPYGYGRHASVEVTALEAPVVVGDIFYSSWGYDQTNIDFYQVVKVGKAMISLRQIDKRVTRARGEPEEYVMPTANKFVGPVITKKLKLYSDRPFVELNSYANAYKWDGKAQAQTGFGWGH
jgi:hypothetical protein